MTAAIKARYTHAANAQFDGQMWQPVILRGNQVAHVSVQRFDDSYTATKHAKDWLRNLRCKGQCYP